jgi:acyl-CoA thioesterase-1
MHTRIITAVVFCTLIAGALTAQNAPSPMDPVTDVPGLPRVLLIGDSISIGYTLPVRELMKGKANVHRPLTNCGPTTRGLEYIDQWLGDGTWDVIHFNWGLHDLKYCNDEGVLVDVEEGHQQVPPKEYAENLEKLVQRLKKTDAKLIWRNTTPVPEGSKGRIPGDEVAYNKAALEIMKKYNIPVQDMYSFVKPRMDEIMLPANVHFTPDGYRRLAETVVTAIDTALKENN